MLRGLKLLLFRWLGVEPEAVVVSFLSGDAARGRAMVEEVKRLVPDRRHYVVAEAAIPEIPGVQLVMVAPGSSWRQWRQLWQAFRRLRVGLAPVLFTAAPSTLRLAAFLLAPAKILAYNARLERHHLRLRTWMASWLFLRGYALDRIFLRPWWLWPLRKEKTEPAYIHRTFDGRGLRPGRPRVLILSPYFPWPLSHGGAVRIFNLLRRAAEEFDVFLISFAERVGVYVEVPREDLKPVLDLVVQASLVEMPRYREPRWASLLPPEVCEFRSKAVRQLIDETRRWFDIPVMQVEYTHLASYGGDVLVEHDVTFDLYEQIRRRGRSFIAWWDFFRWRRFERSAVRRFSRVVAMSSKDAGLLAPAAGGRVRVIANGVDLERFQPAPEPPGQRLLFVGSFRHFPNIVAWRFFQREVWPLVAERFPDLRATLVAGPEAELHWKIHTSESFPASGDRIRVLGFVADVRPLYAETNLVIVPTLVSAGTNLKVLEAMAMERAVVSTACGVEGLGLEHAKSAWIAADAAGFAEGVANLLENPALRASIATAARQIARERFDWDRLGRQQTALWSELMPSPVEVRPARMEDHAAVERIQAASPEAAQWQVSGYKLYDFRVAVAGGRVVGFLVARDVSPGETEILNLAVDPEFRRRGVAARLLRPLLAGSPGGVFLEVRASNTAAQALYRKHGFHEAGLREEYYESPKEDAVVMRF